MWTFFFLSVTGGDEISRLERCDKRFFHSSWKTVLSLLVDSLGGVGVAGPVIFAGIGKWQESELGQQEGK